MRGRSILSSEALHTLAMALMLCCHLWTALFPAAQWLACLGRLAFPIFAFMTAEGYTRTRNVHRYMLRMLLAALLSEIPFNLMYGGSVFYPLRQNALWTLLLGLMLAYLIDRAKDRFRGTASKAVCALLVVLGFVLGYAAMLDYCGTGVLAVLVFRFFPCRGLTSLLCQFLCLYVLNVTLPGDYYRIAISGHIFELLLTVLSLVPIWLYSGRRDSAGTGFKYFCYAFYPAHMLILFLVRRL